MAHTDKIVDSDGHFIIDPITRAIKNESGKTTLIQYDHNSERFTFEVNKLIEGHEMSKATCVEIHYINVASDKRSQNAGLYLVDDLEITEDKVTFSWLVSSNATQLAGTLCFAICFKCEEGDAIVYAWNTAKCDSLTISDGINTSEAIVEEYADILNAWYNELKTYIDERVGDKGTDSDNTNTILDKDHNLNVNLSFEKENNNLKITLDGYPSLDDIAYNGKTYREIFIGGNNSLVVPYGDFEDCNFSAHGITGNPSITTETASSGNRSLKCFGTTSNLIRRHLNNLVKNNSVYIACKVNVTRSNTTRGAGFQLFTNSGQLFQKQIFEVTDGFVTSSDLAILTSLEADFYTGTFTVDGGADIDAYIDDVVVIDVTALFGDDIPTKDDLDTLYDEYIVRKKLGFDNVIYSINNESNEEIEQPEEICMTAFLEKMTEKASELEMTGSYFASPHGMVKTSFSTPQDLLKLAVACSGYPEANRIWGQRSITVNIMGDNARTITVNHGVISNPTTANILAPYQILGGKSGSLIWGEADTDYHRSQMWLLDVENRPVVAVVMAQGKTHYNNIYDSLKELADMVKANINGETVTEGANLQALISANGGYASCLLPQNSSLYACNYPPSKLITREYSVSNAPTVSRMPASTSKAMTMICALDYINDLNEIITIKTADITAGSGSTYYNGDKMTIREALTVMMLESSNTLANAIARVIGNKILANRK